MPSLVGRVQPPAWQTGWGRLRSALLDWIYPPRCGGCGHGGSLWCTTCQALVQTLREPICPHCGRPPTGRPSTPSALCSQCQTFPLDIDGIRSAVMFEGPLREALHHLKYNGRTSLAAPLGRYLESFWQAQPLPADLIVPVPLHASRQRDRGYNQSALLAEQLAHTAQLPVAETALERVRGTAPQVTLNAAERKANVHQAFQARSSVQGQRVVLIDDVCTTGATLEACSVALKQSGAVSVWALTLARAP